MFSIPAGRLIDKYGTRKMIALSLAIMPIPTFLFVFCRDSIQVTGVLVTAIIANMISMPAFSAFMANVIPKDKRGRLISALGQSAAMVEVSRTGGRGFLFFIPAMFGSLVGGYFYEMDPTRPWLLLSIALSLCFILSLILVKDPKKVET
jgi:MFS family permease